ncbi:MAG: PKD domain-containing protein [Bacteroidota bacterium]
MGKELKNIEDLFKSSFEGYRIEPSEKVWRNVNFKLKINKYISTKVFISTAIIATLAIISIFIFNVNEEKENNLTDQLISDSEYIIEQSDSNDKRIDEQTIENTVSETSRKMQLIKKSENINKPKSETERTLDLTPVIVSKSIKVLSNNNLDSLNKINIKRTPPPMPVFTIKSKMGCSPFELELDNLTKSALAFEWNFGDGQISTEASPKYTYRYAGVYKVMLKAVGFGGVAYSYIDSIIVHDPPVASLNWPYESVIQTGQKIIILNESNNITDVKWNFGDNCISNETNGEHVFSKEGEYSIMLKVWTENDCMDSTVIENVKVVSAPGKIVFPNAFTPNMDGPSSGYYSNIDYHNDIFYPKVNAKVEDYEIRIFSKAGVEVFKSTEFSFGWNGYYHNRLLPEGVYLYIASGNFDGGQKFYEKGNVTILHKK